MYIYIGTACDSPLKRSWLSHVYLSTPIRSVSCFNWAHGRGSSPDINCKGCFFQDPVSHPIFFVKLSIYPPHLLGEIDFIYIYICLFMQQKVWLNINKQLDQISKQSRAGIWSLLELFLNLIDGIELQGISPKQTISLKWAVTSAPSFFH